MRYPIYSLNVGLTVVEVGSVITSFENLFCEPSLFRVPAIITSFFRTFFLFKGLCFGLRAYAVRLEGLRVLGSRNLGEPERGKSRNLSPASSM